MKLLIAFFFGVIINGLGVNMPANETGVRPETVKTAMEADYCRLTINGYANLAGMRVKVSLSAEAETCEEAAAEIRQHIIEREVRISR